jgi:hypothetical protein
LSRPGIYFLCLYAKDSRTGEFVAASNNALEIEVVSAAAEEATPTPVPTSTATPIPTATPTPNAAPTFTFVQPLAADDFVVAGSAFSFTWNDADTDSDAQISFYYSTTAAGACTSGTLIASAISEDSATNAYSWTPAAALASNAYFICARIDDSINSVVDTWSARLVVYHQCLWNTGGTNAWATAGNWTGCNSVAPGAYDSVVVPAGGTQPVVTVGTTIGWFGSFATGGGTVTMSTSTRLTIMGDAPGLAIISSDITFAGVTAVCAYCEVYFSPTSNQHYRYVNNDATLTLLDGITFFGSRLFFGDSTTGGSLVTGPANADSNAWPNYAPWQTTFSGASGHISSASIDGLRVNELDDIHFYDYYSIVKFDKLTFRPDMNAAVRLENCNHATVSDTTWSNLVFNNSPGGYAWVDYSINLGSCSGIGPITVTGSGAGYGENYENDPNNLLTWTNGSGDADCLWTGAVDSAWNNAGNWSNCSNGRNDYPDGNDFVTIPSGGTQPSVTGKMAAAGFTAAGGAGGGTITINANSWFTIRGDTVDSSIKFQGASAGCATCQLYGYSPVIGGGATLSLGENLLARFYMISITSSASASAKFEAIGTATLANQPQLTVGSGGILCQSGFSSHQALLDLQYTNHTGRITIDSYCTPTINNVSFVAFETFRFQNCSTADLSASWTGLTFTGTPWNGATMFASTANCSGAGPLDVYPAGAGGVGYRPDMVSDTGGIFVFH